MSIDPILTAPLVLQVHVASALLALVIGPIGLWRRRYDGLHKTAGYTWVVAMAVLCVTSFGMHGGTLALVGPFGFFHALAIWVLVQLWLGVRAAMRRDIATHKGIMRGLYLGGLCIAGAFNFLPYRTVNRMVFPDTPEAGWLAIAALVGLSLLLWSGARWGATSAKA